MADFEIVFSPNISKEEIYKILQALSDYYRACGGVGFQYSFDIESRVS